MRMAGRFSRRLRAWAAENDIPIRDCRVGEAKHEIGEEFLRNTTVQEGLFLILVSRAPAPVWDIHPNRRITCKKPAAYVNHYSFHILGSRLGSHHHQDQWSPALPRAGDPERARVHGSAGKEGGHPLSAGWELLHPYL
jgi:hypothetical protein